MKRNKESEELNYWPGFADLLIAIVLILILVFFIQQITFFLSDAYKQIQINRRQKQISEEIKTVLGADSTAIHSISSKGVNQIISFRSSFLFDDGKWEFKSPRSARLIEKIGQVFKSAVDSSAVEQIVVEGHTNSLPFRPRTIPREDWPYSNWILATNRALTVVKILLEIGLEPPRSPLDKGLVAPSRMISIAGFAEYDFVQEEKNNDGISENFEESKRIQFLLIYKWPQDNGALDSDGTQN